MAKSGPRGRPLKIWVVYAFAYVRTEKNPHVGGERTPQAALGVPWRGEAQRRGGGNRTATDVETGPVEARTARAGHAEHAISSARVRTVRGQNTRTAPPAAAPCAPSFGGLVRVDVRSGPVLVCLFHGVPRNSDSERPLSSCVPSDADMPEMPRAPGAPSHMCPCPASLGRLGTPAPVEGVLPHHPGVFSSLCRVPRGVWVSALSVPRLSVTSETPPSSPASLGASELDHLFW